MSDSSHVTVTVSGDIAHLLITGVGGEQHPAGGWSVAGDYYDATDEALRAALAEIAAEMSS